MDLALFDFDGTLTDRELFGPFMLRAMSPRRLAVGQLTLPPLIIAYRLKLASGTFTRARLADFAFRGARVTHLQAVGEAFAREVIPGTLRPPMMQRIDWHRARGDRIAVVSGGFDFYLTPWCASQGLDLMCSSLEHRDGLLSGRYAGAQCVGEEKARRVRERYDLDRFDAIHAYGDTPEDRALLAMADHRVYRGIAID